MIDYVTHIAGKFTHNYQSRNGSDIIRVAMEVTELRQVENIGRVLMRFPGVTFIVDYDLLWSGNRCKIRLYIFMVVII